MTLVVVGHNPPATGHRHVASDGTTTGTGLPEPRRLCLLDAREAADLLALANHLAYLAVHSDGATRTHGDPPSPARS